MKRGQTIAIAALALAGLLALMLRPTRTDKPVYHGHALGWWLDTWYYDDARCNEAEQAIQIIGTNALPTLLRWISYHEPHWRQILMNRLANPGTRTTPLQRFAMGTAGWRAREAGTAFQILGTNAYPAVLDLAGIVRSNTSSLALFVVIQLPAGHSRIAAQGLTNADPIVRANAAFYFGSCALLDDTLEEINWTNVSQSLVQALHDESLLVRVTASNALARIPPQPTASPPVQ